MILHGIGNRRVTVALIAATLLASLGGGPGASAAVGSATRAAAGPRAYVADSVGNSVSVIDTTTNAVMAAIPVVDQP